MRLVDASGNIVAEYTYDPYGNILTATGDLAQINPLRYRGYYYDTELGMYFLNSRYYDPKVGRFINADSLASTGQGVLGYNMYAYCRNSPILYADSAGFRAVPYSAEMTCGGSPKAQIDTSLTTSVDTSGDASTADNNYSGTLSLGGAVSINIGPWIFGGQAFFTVDANSYIALQYGGFAGISAGPGSDTLSASLTPFFMVTSAPGYEALNGPGLQVGASIPPYVVDYVAILDSTCKKILYSGIYVGGLSAVPDCHITGGYTRTLSAVEFDWELYNKVTQY